METAGTQFESTAFAAIPLWNWCRQVLRLSTVGTSIFWPTPAERQRHGSSTTLRYPGVAVFTTTARCRILPTLDKTHAARTMITATHETTTPHSCLDAVTCAVGVTCACARDHRAAGPGSQIGRASCRAKVRQWV